jgi:hypothetical protein
MDEVVKMAIPAGMSKALCVSAIPAGEQPDPAMRNARNQLLMAVNAALFMAIRHPL